MSLACKGGVFIVGAKRTPFCSFGGALRETTAGHAFAAAASDAIRAARLDPALIDNTVVGNVHYLSQCDGGKTPRYCGIYSGVPIERPALGVNKACGSGLQAIITGALDILTGVAKVSLTGGTEVMSALPYLVKGSRFGATLGKSYHLEDYIPMQFVDGYSGLSLERMAEDLATKHGFDRREVDEFALQSHLRWNAAQQSNAFHEELTKMTVTIKKKQVVVYKDDGPQPNLSLKALSALPTTIEDASVVTAGNSSAPSDGAAALLLADEATVVRQQLAPLARVAAWAAVGSAPAETGLGAGPAVRRLLQIAGLTIEQVDLFEINETFASHALVSTLELQVDPKRVNVSGGAIAMGNPVGATGARMAVHLVHQLRRRKLKRCIAASSCGGGQGVALLIEAV